MLSGTTAATTTCSFSQSASSGHPVLKQFLIFRNCNLYIAFIVFIFPWFFVHSSFAGYTSHYNKCHIIVTLEFTMFYYVSRILVNCLSLTKGTLVVGWICDEYTSHHQFGNICTAQQWL